MNDDSRMNDDSWLDDEAGPVVRPYAMTRGRVRPATSFDLVAFVVATAGPDVYGPALQPEHRALLAAAREPMTVVELAAHTDLALGVTRVLLGDLLEENLISTYEPPTVTQLAAERVLKAVLHGLQAL
jgi:hypothetical protein